MPRYRYLAKAITTGETVLNIGVGSGGLERILLDKGVNVYVLDPSEKAIEKIKITLNLSERAKVGYSQDIPFSDNVFDCVVMSEVLEHLTDEVLNQTLSEVFRVLKPGGRFIGTVPADENLKLSEVICPECGNLFHRWGHLQSFSEERLNSLLRTRFRAISISRKVFVDWNQLNWKGRTVMFIKKVLVKTGVSNSGTTFFFTAYK